MAGLAQSSLIYSQPLVARPQTGGDRSLLARVAARLRLWRRRIRERRALAALTERELADFGATTADVYRELSTPFWRSLPPC
jgi:uncharacterized protein YjiS (DUF1127 family)